MKSIILEEWYWMSWKLCLCEHEKTVSREQESLVQKFSHGFVFCSVDTGDKIWKEALAPPWLRRAFLGGVLWWKTIQYEESEAGYSDAARWA